MGYHRALYQVLPQWLKETVLAGNPYPLDADVPTVLHQEVDLSAQTIYKPVLFSCFAIIWTNFRRLLRLSGRIG